MSDIGTIFAAVFVHNAMEEQKQQIVKTALENFKRYGIKSVSIDDICRQMSMSKKTFYQYYESKDELVEAVLDLMNSSAHDSAEAFMQGKTALECVRMLVDLYQKAPDVHKEPPLNYDLQKYYPQLYKEHVNRILAGTKEILTRHLQQGKDEGVYREDLDVEICAVMYALVQQAFIRNEDGIYSVSPKRLIRFTMESFLRSIVSEEGKKLLNDKYKI